MDEKTFRAKLECPIAESLWRSFEKGFEVFFINNGAGEAEVKSVLGLIWGFTRSAVRKGASQVSVTAKIDGEGLFVVEFATDKPFAVAPPPATRIPDTALLLEAAMLYRKENKISCVFRTLSEKEVWEMENGRKREAV